jgi:hypothetical protein
MDMMKGLLIDKWILLLGLIKCTSPSMTLGHQYVTNRKLINIKALLLLNLVSRYVVGVTSFMLYMLAFGAVDELITVFVALDLHWKCRGF